MPYKEYQNPLIERYASKEMSFIFSPYNKILNWRKLWIALAECEKELGISISSEQIEEMNNNIEHIDFDYAKEMERKLRHDVMAHIHTFGKICPKAMPIIHLGATSAFVGDNTDVILMREAVSLIRKKTINVVNNLKKFSLRYKNTPTLGFTHFQPAQLTTVGKRASMWLQDILLDFEDVEFAYKTLRFRGVKGTTGTQASFLRLFDGDHHKVKQLDTLLSEKFDFDKVFLITGQTYSRKQDSRVLKTLAGIAESTHKIASDIRLLQNLKEIEEPFEKTQIGSSAMAYKRNPMRCERICSLSKYLISLTINPYLIHATQWLERTLDDSANRRISIPEAFLAADAVLELLYNVTDNLIVYEKIIEKHIKEELPFMATENIIMESVKKGSDRQQIHEIIRKHSMNAASRVKNDGKDNNLIESIISDQNIPINKDEMETLVNPKTFIGRAPEQVETFISEEVDPILKQYTSSIGGMGEIKV